MNGLLDDPLTQHCAAIKILARKLTHGGLTEAEEYEFVRHSQVITELVMETI